MKKILILTILIPIVLGASEKSWIPYYLERKQSFKKKYNEPLISIKTNDQKTTKIPASLVTQMQTLKNMQEELGQQEIIPLNQISSTQLRTASILIESALDHQNLTGKKLYNAIDEDVNIEDNIDMLKVTNYLDVKPPLDKKVNEFLVKKIEYEQDLPERKNIPLQEQLKGFGPEERNYYAALIARNYFLRTGKQLPNLSQNTLNHENYAFSIKEYLDHKATHNFLREKLGTNFSVGLDRFMPIGGASVYSSKDDIPITNSVNLANLNINDVEGLNEYKSYIHPHSQPRVKAIWLDHNKIKSLTKPNSFRAFAGGVPAYDEGVVALVFSDNKITEVDPVVFNNLPRLKIVDLRNNPLTREQIQQLRAAHTHIQFRF